MFSFSFILKLSTLQYSEPLSMSFLININVLVKVRYEQECETDKVFGKHLSCKTTLKGGDSIPHFQLKNQRLR